MILIFWFKSVGRSKVLHGRAGVFLSKHATTVKEETNKALALAAKRGQREVVERLVEKGADMTATSTWVSPSVLVLPPTILTLSTYDVITLSGRTARRRSCWRLKLVTVMWWSC